MKKLFFALIVLLSISASASPQTGNLRFFLTQLTPGATPPAGGGGVDTLYSGSLSGTATTVFFPAADTNYRYIYVLISDVIPNTGGTSLLVQFSADGSTIVNGSTSYTWNFNTSSYNQTNGGSGDTAIRIAGGGGMVTTSHSEVTGWFLIHRPDENTTPHMEGGLNLPATPGSSNDASCSFAGTLRATQKVKGIRISVSSGTITGNMEIYGVR